VDGTIELALVDAQNAAKAAGLSTNDTKVVLGRISALLEEVLGYLRGDANGIMYSEFDASAAAAHSILTSDMVVNSLRDGNNERYYLAISWDSGGGTFTLRVVTSQDQTAPAGGGTYANYVDITIAPVYGGTIKTLLIPETEKAIYDALRACRVVGIDWQYQTGYNVDVGEGAVDVRYVDDSEIADRNGTYWDINNLLHAPSNPPYTNGFAVFEITFRARATTSHGAVLPRVHVGLGDGSGWRHDERGPGVSCGRL